MARELGLIGIEAQFDLLAIRERFSIEQIEELISGYNRGTSPQAQAEEGIVVEALTAPDAENWSVVATPA